MSDCTKMPLFSKNSHFCEIRPFPERRGEGAQIWENRSEAPTKYGRKRAEVEVPFDPLA